MLCFVGATSPYCLSLLSAITVMGIGIFSLSFRRSSPNTDRICSIRKATSRPRLSPASVITEKCPVWISIHFDSSLSLSLAEASGEKQPAINRISHPKTPAAACTLGFTWKFRSDKMLARLWIYDAGAGDCGCFHDETVAQYRIVSTFAATRSQSIRRRHAEPYSGHNHARPRVCT